MITINNNAINRRQRSPSASYGTRVDEHGENLKTITPLVQTKTSFDRVCCRAPKRKVLAADTLDLPAPRRHRVYFRSFLFSKLKNLFWDDIADVLLYKLSLSPASRGPLDSSVFCAPILLMFDYRRRSRVTTTCRPLRRIDPGSRWQMLTPGMSFHVIENHFCSKNPFSRFNPKKHSVLGLCMIDIYHKPINHRINKSLESINIK